MCGRYGFTADPAEVKTLFGNVMLPEVLQARFNVAPRQKVPTVVASRDGRTRKLGFVEWGLLPSWADSVAFKTRPINARATPCSSRG